MNTIAAFLQADWAERAGWTLLHSLWQLTAVAAVYAIVAFVLRNRAADARYVLGCVAIIAMVGLPVGTYAWLPHVAPWGIEEAFHAPAAVTLRTESPGALPPDAADAQKTMRKGGGPLPPAKDARMRDVLDAVFGTPFGEVANPLVSRYPKMFRAIHKSFAERAGRFQHVLTYRAVETPRGEYLEARCKWEKAVMLVRLTFDEQEQVTGFWLARDRDGPTPKGFRRGGYVIGAPMLRLAGYSRLKHTSFNSLSLHVRLTAPGGKPLQKPPDRISVWKQTTDPRARSSSKGRLVTLFDGTRWQWVAVTTHAGNGEWTFKNLSPGNYRIGVGHGAQFDCVCDIFRVVNSHEPTTFVGEYVKTESVNYDVALKID